MISRWLSPKNIPRMTYRDPAWIECSVIMHSWKVTRYWKWLVVAWQINFLFQVVNRLVGYRYAVYRVVCAVDHICLSVTFVYCIQTATSYGCIQMSKLLSQHCSSIILVSWGRSMLHPFSVLPHLFCGAVVMRKGGESSWGGPWH